MAFYCATGRLGSGKTLWSMGKVQEAMSKGLPIATNLDLFVEHLPRAAGPVYRLPDVPSITDLMAIGEGGKTRNEKEWGWLVLDEGGIWFNSRQWGGADRQALIDWFLLSRKRHWNVILLAQGVKLLDSQIRENVLEYHVVCRRADRLKVPYLSALLSAVTLGHFEGNLPQVHMASLRYGLGQQALNVGTEFFQSKDLWRAYDTDQKISSSYPHGLFCYLPRRHLERPVSVAAAKPRLRVHDAIARAHARGVLTVDQATRLAARANRALDAGARHLLSAQPGQGPAQPA